MQLPILFALTLGFATVDVAGKTVPLADPACAAIDEARDAMLSGRRLEPAEANALHAKVARAASCPAARALPFDACEGNATNVVAAALFSAGLDAATIVRASLADERCMQQILPAAQQATRPTSELRDVLLEASSDAAWLVLGSAAMNARASGDETLARTIDDAIASSKSGARIEAAGNAGCRSCGAMLENASRDDDPWVRRSAAGALRFVPRSARTMCAALERDPDETVREHAAWALGFSPEEHAVRVACLANAASSDASDEVRATARRSLEGLAKNHTDLEMP